MEEHLSLEHGSLCKNLGQWGSKFKVLKFILRTTKINFNIKEAKEQRFTIWIPLRLSHWGCNSWWQSIYGHLGISTRGTNKLTYSHQKGSGYCPAVHQLKLAYCATTRQQIWTLEVALCRRQQIPCLVSNYIYIIASVWKEPLQDLKHKCLKSNLEAIEKYGMEIGKSIWLLYHA